jgi:penicillin G amidase
MTPRSISLAGLALALLLGGLGCSGERGARSAESEDRIEVRGIAQPVRIVSDLHGIPHVQAGTLEDLYFGWGYATARDRLWEMEYNRRGARGELWQWLGNRKLRDDGGAQLFELAERAQRIWERERRDPEVRSALEAYTNGINCRIERCRSGRAPWPDELAQLGREATPWTPADCYLMLLAQGLVLDLAMPEIDEQREIEERGRAAVEARRRFEQQFLYLTIPDSAASRLYGHAGDAAAAEATHERAALRSITPELLDRARASLAGWRAPSDEPDLRASNVFAVGGRRSASGKPLFANDPHLGLGTPGPFHVVHVTVPGVLDAIGAAVPGLPSIVSGRNRACAWGVTALSADVIDVYADSLSRDGKRVRSRGAWVPLRTGAFSMRYRVLGLVPIPVPGQVRRYAPLGPVLATDPKRGIALVARWAGDDEAITLRRLLGIEHAASADEVAERCRSLVTPGLNVVAADTLGTVVYQATGALPRRGFAPVVGLVPDDDRHAWRGVIAPDDMPRWHAPADGFVVNANNLPVGSGFPEPLPRYDWAHDRAAEIAERLARNPRVTIGDLKSVQNDCYSRGAARFVPRLLHCAETASARPSPRAEQAIAILKDWDYLAVRDRVGPTVYRAWLGALTRRSALGNLPGLTAAALDGRAPEALRAPKTGAPETPSQAAMAALEEGLAEASKTLGPDLSTWTWGRAHQAHFLHALEWRDPTWRTPLTPADGDNSTPCVGRSGLPSSIEFQHGPVFRHVVDLAIPDSSFGIVPPGNSGVRAGAHGADHLAHWADHEYVPLLLDWKRVEAARESETMLLPATGPAPVAARSAAPSALGRTAR